MYSPIIGTKIYFLYKLLNRSKKQAINFLVETNRQLSSPQSFDGVDHWQP